MAHDDVGAGLRHRGGFIGVEHIRRGQHVFRMRLGDHVDLEAVGHSGLFEVGAERAVDDADGREVLHAGESDRLHVVEEHIHRAERIGAVHAGEHRRVLHHGQHFGGHLHDDGVGVAIGHQAGERAAPGHAVAARIVDHDQVDAAGFLAFGREAGAGAAADDRLAARHHGAEFLHQG